jgi:RNA polymerase sigma-70 factor (ECF subfamily)
MAPSQVPRAATLPKVGHRVGPDDGRVKDGVGELSVRGCDVNRERALVRSACRGEPSAVEALYRMYYAPIFRYIFFRLRCTVATEDVTHQVFLGMCQGLSRYRDEGKPFVAWLYGIAKKQVAYHQRSQRRAAFLVQLDSGQELIADTAGPHATLEERERRLAIAKALCLIPDRQREALILRYILSFSLAETAVALGRTEGAVKQLQLRGLSSLRSSLDMAERSRSL